jgi:ATP-binding cassette subfamily C (CFTR/MRP) protein 1
MGDLIVVSSPLILLEIVTFLRESYQTPTPPPVWKGYVLAVSLLILQIIQTFFLNKSFEVSMRVGYYLRTSLCGSIFRKSLRLSQKARQVQSSTKKYLIVCYLLLTLIYNAYDTKAKPQIVLT